MSFAQPFIEKRLARMLGTLHRVCELGGLRKPPSRTVFMHIPKCGGTSINWAAKSYLGGGKSGKVVLVDDTASPAERREQVKRARNAVFVGGHFGFETLELVRGDALVFTVLRDPFSRLRSVHAFLAALDKRNPIPPQCRQMSAEDFFACRVPSVLQWTDNVIARTLATSWDRSKALSMSPAALADIAIRNLSRFDVVADTRTLQQDMAMLSADIGIPTFSHLGWRNASKPVGRIGHAASTTTAHTRSLQDLALPLIQADIAVYNHLHQKSRQAPTTRPRHFQKLAS